MNDTARRSTVLIAIALAATIATTPACTLVGIGAAASTVASHNELVDSSDRWNYTTPVVIGALVGLAVDIYVIVVMKSEWGQPVT